MIFLFKKIENSYILISPLKKYYYAIDIVHY
ncbi:hypothetical protein Catovirus_2_55 [Catovirus CTV1]|uniref:Uncharacterized protein n=1 Tax=Catovirus CTV1 TaxID=1977631 RepID=A0A1V0SBN3_9VIRU|nr:hypothetical protein Catovirus_2_55 [Catovirus CTV1]